MRKEQKVLSLKDFHRRLGGEEQTGVGYEAVRNYHFDRDPPVKYLARVVEVFPQYRLEWLAAGWGKPTHEEETSVRVGRVVGHEGNIHDLLMEAVPDIRIFAPSTYILFTEFVVQSALRVQAVQSDQPNSRNVEADAVARHAWMWWELVVGPWNAIGRELGHFLPVDAELSALNEYIRGMLNRFDQALSLGLPRHTTRQEVETRPKWRPREQGETYFKPYTNETGATPAKE